MKKRYLLFSGLIALCCCLSHFLVSPQESQADSPADETEWARAWKEIEARRATHNDRLTDATAKLKSEVRTAESYEARADIYLEESDFSLDSLYADNARRDLDDAIKLAPTNPILYLKRAMTHIGAPSLADLETAYSLDPSNKSVQRALAKALSTDSPKCDCYCDPRSDSCQKNGEASLKRLERAVRVDPAFCFSYTEKGAIYQAHKRLAEAEKEYTLAIECNRDHEGPEVHVARRVMDDGQISSEATNRSFGGKENLIDSYSQRAVVRWKAQNFDGVIADHSSIIALDPNNANAYFALGDTYEIKGELEQAKIGFTQAIERSRDDGRLMYYTRRARLLIAKDDLKGAKEDYDVGVRNFPSSADAFHARARFFSTVPDKSLRNGEQGVSDALRACDKFCDESYTGEDPRFAWMRILYMDTLAAAYAEAGQFEDAVRWQSKALAEAPVKEGNEEMMHRLSLYKEKRAFYDDTKNYGGGFRRLL